MKRNDGNATYAPFEEDSKNKLFYVDENGNDGSI
jgi:hypothetical protein